MSKVMYVSNQSFFNDLLLLLLASENWLTVCTPRPLSTLCGLTFNLRFNDADANYF